MSKQRRKPKPTRFYLRIRSRHPSHAVLRRNQNFLFPEKYLLRLGSTTEGSKIPESRTLNSIEAIQTSSNKLKMKAAFAKAKVTSPEFCSVGEIRNNIKKGTFKFPVLAKKVYGSKAKGMKLIENESQLKTFLSGNTSGYYFEQFYNYSREYRLHVWDGGCFYTCRKLRRNDAKERYFFNSLNCVWILETNPSFNKPKTWDKIVKACIDAKNAVGLDIAAIDIRVNKKGDFVILETNSAPSLGEYGVKAYEETLPKIIKHHARNF